MTDLLHGVTVIELSSFVAAPLAGMVLGQLGAMVIRVDPVGGAADAHRWPLTSDGTSLYWAGLNKGKRSMQADLRDESGPMLVAGLLQLGEQRGGILITNAVNTSWTDYDSLAASRPDLIHVHVKGRSDGSPAVDYTVNAASGFPLVTGPPDHLGPVNHVMPAWDIACGLYAATGMLAALRRRDLTGEGARIEVCLEDVAVSTAGHLGFLAQAQLTGIDRPRIGNHLYGGFANHFSSADGEWYMVVVLTRRQWRELVEATALRRAVASLEVALVADFEQDSQRFAHRDLITALLQEWFAGLASDDVDATLSGTQVLWSRFKTFTQVVQGFDTQSADDLMAEIDQPGVGRHLAPSSPIVVDGRRTPVRPAPVQGADTVAILSEVEGR